MAEAHRWDPEGYATHAGFVPDAGAAVVEHLAPRPAEKILDLGCGDGVLTEALVKAGAHVVGVDSSAEMVAAARNRGVDAQVMDGVALNFVDEFDAVFSNAALHWMKDLASVIAGVNRALKPGGRFVGEMGGEGNVATISQALREAMVRRGVDGHSVDPWVFPSPEAFATLLESQGLQVEAVQLIDRPTVLPGDIEGWLETFAGSFLHHHPLSEHPAIIAEVREAVRPRLQSANGAWVADYVRLRFIAHKPVSRA